MGAGYFFARPRRKAGLFMGGENDGATAQAQFAGEPQTQGDQAAQTAGLQGANVTDNGGDAVARAHKDYEAALAERDARIAELEGEIAAAEAELTAAPPRTSPTAAGPTRSSWTCAPDNADASPPPPSPCKVWRTEAGSTR